MAGIYLGRSQQSLIPILLLLLLDHIPFWGVWCDTHPRRLPSFVRWLLLKQKNRQQ